MRAQAKTTHSPDEAASRLLHPSAYVEADEPTTCICPEPKPLGEQGIFGWNEHVCQTCHRPVL